MMMGHFISRLFESALHVEKNTRAIQCHSGSDTVAPGRNCPGNVVQMREAMAAFIGSDSVAVSFHCK